MDARVPRERAGNRRMDIMLVEDNPSYVELTRRALREIAGGDLCVEVAATGERAVEVLSGTSPRNQPRLIILDIRLPKMSGLDVLRRIRAEAATRYVPVVMLTSSSLAVDITESYRLGANGYAQRPMSFEKYVKVLAELIAYWLTVNIPAPRE